MWRRWIVIVRVTSRLSDRWKRAGSSSCNSATSHFTAVHAALLTDTYIAFQRVITNVAVLCGGSCSRCTAASVPAGPVPWPLRGGGTLGSDGFDERVE